EVVLGHWDSWAPDAIVLDKERSIFADPEGVHRLDHEGRFLRSRGRFTVPRTPQERPIVVPAGQRGGGGPGGLERGDLAQRIRGRELRRGQGDRA
ncbi:MAG: hypothetical protein OXC15_03645, partial [Rhodospirillaceae bacterium]|nr:hypothetical protein [Rhodospirillaceae bacterium]